MILKKVFREGEVLEMMFKAHEEGLVKEDGTLKSALSFPLALNLTGWEGSQNSKKGREAASTVT